MDKDDVYAHYYSDDYHAWEVYDADPIIKRVVNALVDGTIPSIIREGQEIFDALVKDNDEYFNLLDFHAYVAAQEKIDTLYKDQKTWRKMSLMNTANGGQFSLTIRLKNMQKKFGISYQLNNHSRNKQVKESTVQEIWAFHFVDGGVPNLTVEIDKLDEYTFGEMIYFFEKACAISGLLMGVNPFDQPGVEAYKKNMFALLGKPGYEAEKEALLAY
jgi:Carbohydrate phosphorylase/Phosphoglucose isomerase